MMPEIFLPGPIRPSTFAARIASRLAHHDKNFADSPARTGTGIDSLGFKARASNDPRSRSDAPDTIRQSSRLKDEQFYFRVPSLRNRGLLIPQLEAKSWKPPNECDDMRILVYPTIIDIKLIKRAFGAEEGSRPVIDSGISLICLLPL
jgi:hypothetical protein